METENIYVEFGGAQVLVRTNIPEVGQMVRNSHSAMLVASGGNVVLTLDVMRHEKGYSMNHLFYDTVGPPSFLFDEVREKILQAFISARSDLMWVHAGAVSLDEGALLIAGISADGKSTLTTLLTQHGWRFMSDEAVGIDTGTLRILPYVRAPRRRLYPGRALAASEMADFTHDEWRVPEHSLQRDPAPIRSVLFTRFEHGAVTSLVRRTPGEAALQLSRGLWNLEINPGPFIATVAKLVSTVPCRSVTFGDGEDAANKLNELGKNLFETAAGPVAAGFPDLIS